MAAYYGDAGEHRYTQSTVANEEIRALAARVTCSVGPRWEQAYPRERGAELSIRTKAGATLAIEVPLPNGEPENPASDEDFIRKFKQNTSDLDQSAVKQLQEVILTLEQHSLSKLTQKANVALGLGK
jgi:2-methylcitrate dehydratase PrpD